MPRLRGQWRQQQAPRHQRDAELHHGARTGAIHQAADQRADAGRNQKAERERACRDPAFPAELIDDGGKEQRKGGAGIDADRHGDERHGDDDPAVKEGKPLRVMHRHSGARVKRANLRCAIAHRGISRFRVWSGACHRAAQSADPLGPSRNDAVKALPGALPGEKELGIPGVMMPGNAGHGPVVL